MDNRNKDQDFFAQMAEAIVRRYRLNADKSLQDVYQLNADFLDTDSDAEFAVRNRAEMLSILADMKKFEQLVDLFLNQAIAFTYASNQFVQISPREEAELRRIYTVYLRGIEQLLTENDTVSAITAGLNRLVTGHFHDLRSNITRFFDREAVENPQANVILQKVVCAEYRPELQLEILGVQLKALVQPVLDLGCGKSGRLVNYLNENGIQAYGVDRVVDPSSQLIQADWLDYKFEAERWGTILSHMAFSNHFVFNHLYRNGSAEPYARQYMAILRALKLRGSFFYTPGLPFIEAYLPADKYRLSRHNVKTDEKLYACQVLRYQ